MTEAHRTDHPSRPVVDLSNRPPDPEADPPDVVVWEADGSVTAGTGYGRAIARRFRHRGAVVSVVPLERRRPTRRELAAGRHVVSGGNTSVGAAVPWLEDTRRRLAPILARAIDGDAELSGICFGAQLIATMVAGPEAVVPHRDGMQAGLCEVADLDGAGAGSTEGRPTRVVSSFHFHHVRPRPLEAAGAVVTMASARTPVQGYRLGRGLRGVQFHPELEPAALRDALRANRSTIRRNGGSPERALRSVRRLRRRWDAEAWSDVIDTGRPVGPIGVVQPGPAELAELAEVVAA